MNPDLLKTTEIVQTGDILETKIFDAFYGDNPFKVLRTDEWQVNEQTIAPFLPEKRSLYFVHDATDTEIAVYDDTAARAQINLSDGKVYAMVAGLDEAAVQALMDKIRETFKVAENDEEGRIGVKFWVMGSRGPESIHRRISVPTLEAVEHNYAANTWSALGKLKTDFQPQHGGQLLLWHGKPGTGKTYALRALGDAWRSWCKVEYVVDPEKFFGSEPGYLLNVLMGSGHNEIEFDEHTGRVRKGKSDPWRLLVFEDTGEMLSSDARERTGQGLSRLLNTVDGLIGQGLRFMILITTNEELGRMHPAVARPGRAAISIKFEELSPEEIKAWYELHGLDTTNLSPNKVKTLAELYAVANEFENIDPQIRKIGFGR